MEITPTHPLGLLAGGGRLPILFAESLRQRGIPLVIVGLRYEAEPELKHLAQQFFWAGAGGMGRIIRLFKRCGVQRMVTLGKIFKGKYLHRPWALLSLLPDWRTLCWFLGRNRKDNGDDSLMLSIIAEFARDGIAFESPIPHCPELLVENGILTRRKPTASEERDIAFGWNLAKEMGRLDVGQSVVVKGLTVLAVEAIEGTDRAIARAGELCRAGGFVVVKVAKPQQDARFDLPAVGVQTIEMIYRSGGKVLAIEANQTILVDREATVALANRYGLSIVALKREALIAAA
jgi:DUF1009 family protein